MDAKELEGGRGLVGTSESQEAPSAYRYDVFISYRHGELDEEIATRVHRLLEAYRTPKSLVARGVAPRLTRVFRDREEFAATNDLSASIGEALAASRYLLVICSPRARESEWIAAEVARFHELGRGENIIALLLDGEPESAFPVTLATSGNLNPEPLAADIRSDSRAESLRLLRTEILRVLATVLGCSFDDLRRRQQERARNQMIAISGGSLTLAAVLGGLALYAFVMQDAAKRSEVLAQERLAVAQVNQSKFLADAAQRQLDSGRTDLATSLILAALPQSLESPDRPPVPEAIAAMSHAFHRDRLLGVLAGHTDAVLDTALSPDGSLVATASADRTARIWDVRTGAELGLLAGHTANVRSVEFAPDGKTLLTGSDDFTARVWDVESGRQLSVLSHGMYVWRARFSPDGKSIATASWDKTAGLWDAATGAQVCGFASGSGWLTDAVFSPDGSKLVTVGEEHVARLWDTASCQLIAVLEGHDGWISSAVFTPDGSKLLTGALDKTARLWDAASGAFIRSFGGGNYEMYDMAAVAFSPTGRYLVAGTEYKKARIWDVETGELVRVLSGHTGWVEDVAYSHEGSLIATASGDLTIRLWDAQTGDPVGILTGHQQGFGDLTWTPDDRRLVALSTDKTARIFDPNVDHQYRAFIGHETFLSSARYSADGGLVVTTSSDKTARLWDARTGVAMGTLAGHQDVVTDGVFSPDGTRVATLSHDHTLRLWGVASQELVRTIDIGSKPSGMRFNPAWDKVVTWGEDKTLRLWDVATGTELRRLDGHTDFITDVRWDADGKRIATSSMDHSARVFDVDSGSQITALMGHTNFVETVEFSPDGNQVLTGSWDGTARLWDAAAGAQIRSFGPHGDTVQGARFAYGGQWIVTGSIDGFLRVWDAQTGALLRQVPVGAAIVSIEVSPDGMRVATADTAFLSLVWDLDTGAEIVTIDRHRGPSTTVFSPDGTRLLTGSDDSTARAFDIPPHIAPDDMLAVARSRAASPLSAADRRDFFLQENLLGITGGALDLDDCDRLAGNPFDPGHVGAGMLMAAMDFASAKAACESAVAKSPSIARYRYQLGRAQEAAQDYAAAYASYEMAVGADYPAAYMNLGILFLNARGVERDAARARDLLTKAYEKGVIAAGTSLAAVTAESQAPDAQAEARRLLLEAAELGDPSAQYRVAAQADRERDEGLTALRYYTLAETMFIEVGDTASAAAARGHRATLARALAPAQVAEAWREAQALQARLATRSQ
jgi:WD40 repeat protein